MICSSNSVASCCPVEEVYIPTSGCWLSEMISVSHFTQKKWENREILTDVVDLGGVDLVSLGLLQGGQPLRQFCQRLLQATAVFECLKCQLIPAECQSLWKG